MAQLRSQRRNFCPPLYAHCCDSVARFTQIGLKASDGNLAQVIGDFAHFLPSAMGRQEMMSKSLGPVSR